MRPKLDKPVPPQEKKERVWEPEELRLPLYEDFAEMERLWKERLREERKKKEERGSNVIIIQM
jgi:hypothetical protein